MRISIKKQNVSRLTIGKILVVVAMGIFVACSPRTRPTLTKSNDVVQNPTAINSVELAQSQIKEQAGCFDVSFDFKEVSTSQTAIPSPEHHSKGLEYVFVENEEPGRVMLQHILITPYGAQKHWRQEWVYEAKSMMSYIGVRHWNTVEITNPSGLWLQKVYQVDDSPRYECASTWNTENKTWECTAWSPLPRREFTTRADYNILNRGNKVQITNSGWVHSQSNEKLKIPTVGDGPITLLGTEEGANTYVSTDATRCQEAITWWNKYGPAWIVVQDMWEHIRGHHPELKLAQKVNGQLLWETLFKMTESAIEEGSYTSKEFKKAIHDVIHLYFE